MSKIKELMLEDTYRNSDFKIGSIERLQKDVLTLESSLEVHNKAVAEITKLQTEIKELVDKGKIDLNLSLKKAAKRLKEAIVSQRSMSGYIYTTNIPLVANKSNAVVKEGVVYGLQSGATEDNLVFLTSRHIKNLNVGKLNFKGNIEKLENFQVDIRDEVLTLKVDLREYANRSVQFEIVFNSHVVIEVLEGSNLVIEKSLKRTLSLPITQGEFVLRLHKTKEGYQTISVKSFSITEKKYKELTEYLSPEVPVNKNFEYVFFDMCDNNFSNQVNIEYTAIINGIEINIAGTNRLQLPSILTSKTNLTLTNYLCAEENEKVVATVPSNINLNRVFIKNNKKLETSELWLETSKVLTLNKSLLVFNNTDKVFLNEEEVTGTFEVNTGISKIIVLNPTGQTASFNYAYLNTIIENIYIQIPFKIEEQTYENTALSFTKSDLAQAFTISKDTRYDVYIVDNVTATFVEKVQLKMKLESLDKKTVPFVSRVIVRGI